MKLLRLHLLRSGFATVFLGLSLSAIGYAEERPSYSLADGRTVVPLETFQECDVCPEMIVMPLGEFMMGAIRGESRNPFDVHRENATGRRRGSEEVNVIPFEHPRHNVEMDILFAIGRNEITHSEWMQCVNEGACNHDPDHTIPAPQKSKPLGPDHPVINVSYLDALEYTDWLNSKVGIEVYRLPTEAEWEYSARAGSQTRYSQGEELTADQANFSRRGTERLRGADMPELVDRLVPVPVNSLDAENSWGLRHMSGNVDEWTQTCWTSEHLGLSSASAYLKVNASLSTCHRVSKGGAFSSNMDLLRLASRKRSVETRRREYLGLRIVRVFPKKGEN